MSRRWRTILLAHCIASWVAVSVCWIYQLSVGHNPSNTFRDPQFWLILCVTEIAAPIILPIFAIAVVVSFQRDMKWIVASTACAYLATAQLAGWILWRRQSAAIARDLRESGRCEHCGYDLRATPGRCPECGELPKQPQIRIDIQLRRIMKHKTLFRLLLKFLGVWLFANGISSLASAAVTLIMMVVQMGRAGPNSMLGYYVASIVPPFFQLVMGAYLFFDGKWVADKAIAGNRPYCPECGYDLTGNTSDRCPECGITTPIVAAAAPAIP